MNTLFDEILLIKKTADENYKKELLTEEFENIQILHDLLFRKKTIISLDWLKLYKSKICQDLESIPGSTQDKLNKINLICSILVLPKFERTNRAYQKIADKYQRKINEVLYNEYDWDDIRDSHKLTASDKQRTLIAFYTLVPPRDAIDLSLLTLISDGDEMDPDLNYVCINKVGNPNKIVYFNYLNNETYGTVQLMIGETLKSILKKHIRKNKIATYDAVSADDEGRYYSPTNFSEFVLDTFSRVSCMPLTDEILIQSYIDMILKRDLPNKLIFAIERQMSRKLR